MNPPDTPRSAPDAPAPAEVPSLLQVLESATLFRGRPEIVIRHNGREYRLRQTRLGKLILTA
jgi:hemin uptake protein HemP